MKKLIIICFMWCFGHHLYAQSIAPSFFTNGDKILAQVNEKGYYYRHKVEKGHTVYSLAKIFKLSVEKIYQYNGLATGASLDIGQALMIPLDEGNIITPQRIDAQRGEHYIPIYYHVKPKETLFRISKVYFNQSIEDMMMRNKLLSPDLDKGQLLIVGWLPLHQQSVVDSSLTGSSMHDIAEVSTDSSSTTAVDTLYSAIEDSTSVSIPFGFNVSLLGTLTYDETMNVVKKSTVAVWDRNIPDNGAVFALHETARINSYIYLYNPIDPQIKRSIRAKVIGRIPKGAYTEDVKLILSPRAAKQLGSLDQRFKVEIEIIE